MAVMQGGAEFLQQPEIGIVIRGVGDLGDERAVGAVPFCPVYPVQVDEVVVDLLPEF